MCFMVLDLRVKGCFGSWASGVGVPYAGEAIPGEWRVGGKSLLSEQGKGLSRWTFSYSTCNSNGHHHFIG